jgi:type II secretory pathway component PulK
MAMVALLVVMLVAGALVRSLIAAHRQSRQYADELQAQWLAEAGLARAAARLRADANYQGEVWTVPLGADATNADENAKEIGQATITVEPTTKRITVEAIYPTDEHRRILVRLNPEP